MKKSVILIITIIMCISLCACSHNENQPPTSTQAVTENETQGSADITARRDSEKGKRLKSAVAEELGTEDGALLEGDFDTGCFTYKFSRDAQIMYAKERDEAVEAVAKENAQSLVDEISSFYGVRTGLAMTESFEAKQIGSGDNGIDSVQYRFTYVNSQNQQLVIYADSDGVISYADCTFIW